MRVNLVCEGVTTAFQVLEAQAFDLILFFSLPGVEHGDIPDHGTQDARHGKLRDQSAASEVGADAVARYRVGDAEEDEVGCQRHQEVTSESLAKRCRGEFF